MLLGCIVTSAAEAEAASRLPFDYLELKGDLLVVDDAELPSLRERLLAAGLPLRAMTSPLPRRFGCRVVGPDADPARALEVFTRMCDRAASLGVGTVVLGSGQARSIPPGWDAATAGRQFQAFAAAAAAAAAARGLTLALEPLHRGETNLVNSCAQARRVVDDLEGAGLTIAVDLFHVVTQGLDVDAEVGAAAGAIGHAHTSSIPRGSLDYRLDVQAAFVAALHTAGYDGTLTVEEDFPDAGRDAPAAARVFRPLLASVAAGTEGGRWPTPSC